jgi:uncharacterized integral membrane protein
MAEEQPVRPPDGPAAREGSAAREAEQDKPIPVRLILLGLLGLYLVLFVVLNAKTVKIRFVFFTSRISLIVALVLAAAIGFVGGYLVNELRARRRRATKPS